MIRRPLLPALAFFLALSLGCAAALPSLGVWQCRHAARFIAIPFTTTTTTMPCHMGVSKMPGTMPCCRPKQAVHGQATLSPPDCNPGFVSLAALPVVNLGQSQPDFHKTLFALDGLSLRSEGITPTPVTTSVRQRPPPDTALSPADRIHTPGLRAPPAI